MARRKPEPEDDFKEMELWEHLAELRSRLIRSVCYLVLGLVIAWQIYPALWDLFFRPLEPVLNRLENAQVIITSFVDGFMLQLQVSLIAGLVVAIPLVTMEVWGFVAPGLTRNERRACAVVFPLSVVFFLGGVACGYSLMGVTIEYFAQFIQPDMALMQHPVQYMTFLIKMVVAFGLCFQLPLILMFLAWIGLVSSKMLKEQWRLAVVLCFVVAALATPGGDPMTMTIMASPLAILYIASIGLVRLVERIRARTTGDPDDDEG